MNARSVVGVLEGCDPLQQYNIAAFPVSLCRLLSRAMIASLLAVSYTLTAIVLHRTDDVAD